ncbi:hypothetical protein BDQ94DRAFT_133423 [Aspergillus welwitschiae]|uniref:Uncharacterized protein n=1 Tax=Aspergillus welwitschiae TaxID=1341132 RepID=A0A3F3QJW4_9EURO|nr:hypothetical protein BDQ94DRAFT_133423 [Aspergillus welwitschiae]RDH39644.1 hypothetical protein BDQ94DRAFT_133423 [Aspergillus welwitschiae]
MRHPSCVRITLWKHPKPHSTVLAFQEGTFCMDPGTRHEIPRPDAARDPERRIMRTDSLRQLLQCR